MRESRTSGSERGKSRKGLTYLPAVPVIVKIETTDGIQAAHCMGIPLHDGLESFLLRLAVPEGKIVFPFVAEEAVGGVFAGNRFIRLHRKHIPR